MPSLVRLTDATIEPVSVEWAKDHSNVLHSDDDATLARLIKVSRQYAERITGRSFITQTWVKRLDAFPYEILLEHGPVIAITHVKYLDTDGAEQTMSSDDYQLDANAIPARLSLARDTSNWPTTSSEDYNAVIVTYTAGYGATAESVPVDIRHAILILAEHFYVPGRELVTDVRVEHVPTSAFDLLAPYVLLDEL